MRRKWLNTLKGIGVIILMICAKFSTMGQHKVTGTKYAYSSELCSEAFHFLNDSIYKGTSGCEQFFSSYLGKYKIKADTLFLSIGIPGLKIGIQRIDSFKSDGDLLILRFFDQSGENISKKIVATFIRPDGRIYPVSYDSVKNALVTTKIRKEAVRIATLDKFGANAHPINLDYANTLELNYHLEVPKLIKDLDLYKKDIAEEKGQVLIFNNKGLAPVIKHRYFPFEEDVFFKKEQ